MKKVNAALWILLLAVQPLLAQEESAGEVVTTVAEPAVDLSNEVLDGIDNVPDTAGGAVNDITDGSGLGGIVGQDMADDIGDLIDSVIDVVDDIVETVTDVVRDIVDGLTGLLPGNGPDSGTIDVGCEALKDGGVLEPQAAADGNPLLLAPGERSAIDPNRCGL